MMKLWVSCFHSDEYFLFLQAVSRLLSSTVKPCAFCVSLSQNVLEHSEAELRYELCTLHHRRHGSPGIQPPLPATKDKCSLHLTGNLSINISFSLLCGHWTGPHLVSHVLIDKKFVSKDFTDNSMVKQVQLVSANATAVNKHLYILQYTVSFYRELFMIRLRGTQCSGNPQTMQETV